jgi:hypothetical protein
MKLSLMLSMLSGVSASVTDCGVSSSLFKIKSMSFSPDPTVPGVNSTLLLSMAVPEQINDGTATYAFTYNFLPFQPTVDPICQAVNCPILVGDLSTVSSYPILSDLSGSLNIKISWKDLNQRELMCVMIRTTAGVAAKQLIPYSNKPVLPQPMCPQYYNSSIKILIKRIKKIFKKISKKIMQNSTKSSLRGKV